MDKLSSAAHFYNENLLSTKFHLTAARKGNIIEFDIIFSAKEFKHLAGLQKLTDLPDIQTNSSEVVFRQILNNEVTWNTISKSKYVYRCEPRLDQFQEIKSALFSKELMVKSLHGEFNTIRADFMLTHKNDDFGYAHLFLKESDKKGITVPVTFIINSDNKYIRNNPNKWTVLSIEEIKSKEQSVEREHEKNKRFQSNPQDEALKQRIARSPMGNTFNRLYAGRDKAANADEKLMEILAFFSDKNTDQMVRVFKTSALYDEGKGEGYLSELSKRATSALSRQPNSFKSAANGNGKHSGGAAK